MSVIQPKFLSLVYQKNCLYLHYTREGKSFCRQMPIRNLSSPTKTLVDQLINHHSPLLNSVNDHQLLDLLNLLKNRDFNKLDDSELLKVKQDMEKDFIKNQISVTDPKFKYDVRVIFNF
jgi:hypothetical protein